MRKIVVVLVILIGSHINYAQGRIIRNLAFEGAGIRGIAYCGAIEEMESRGLMVNISRVGGTSSGAIVALMISLGYSGKEIENQIGKLNFKKLNDGHLFFIGGISRLKKYFGWYRGRAVEKFLADMIKSKTGNSEMSFAELHAQGFKDLYVTGTCLNKQKSVIFSYKTFPDMKVRDAVRISMSLPLYFEAVFMDSVGRVYHNPKQKTGLDVMVDGGFTENFPINIFDTLEKEKTIGFRIDSDNQIKNDAMDQQLAAVPVKNIGDYMMAFYIISIENLNRQRLTAGDWKRTISISDGNVAPKIRKLSKEEIDLLINNGRLAVKNHLN